MSERDKTRRASRRHLKNEALNMSKSIQVMVQVGFSAQLIYLMHVSVQ